MTSEEQYWIEYVILRDWIECTHDFNPQMGANSYYDECKNCGYSLPKLENKVKELLNKENYE